MDRYHFRLPVRVTPERHEPVLEIYDVRHAAEFLMALPDERHGKAHQDALGACLAAMADSLPVEDARWLLVTFARRAGILSRDTPPPVRRPRESARLPF